MHSIKKSRQMIFFVLAISFFLMILLTACSVHSSPKSIVNEFLVSLQLGDLERGLACLTPTRQAEYQTWMTLFGGIAGVDIDTIFGGLISFASSSTFLDMDFKISGTKGIDSTHTKVSVDFYKDGEKNGSTIIKCVKIDSDWYIDL